MGANTGAPLNRDLMKKLVGKAHGVDTSHIKIKSDTGKDVTGFKPTPEEVERWARGENIEESRASEGKTPTVNIKEANKGMMKSFLQKQAKGQVPAPIAPPVLAPQKVGGVGGSDPDFEFRYNVNSPIPDLNKSYSSAGVSRPTASAPQQRYDLPTSTRSGSSIRSISESAIEEELPADELKKTLQGLGEAMVENAGGRFGLVDFYPFNGVSFGILFQHRLQESGGETGLQIEVNLNPANSISQATVTVTLSENTAVSQSVSRSYLNPEDLIEDLTNLIDLAGQNV